MKRNSEARANMGGFVAQMNGTPVGEDFLSAYLRKSGRPNPTPLQGEEVTRASSLPEETKRSFTDEHRKLNDFGGFLKAARKNSRETEDLRDLNLDIPLIKQGILTLPEGKTMKELEAQQRKLRRKYSKFSEEKINSGEAGEQLLKEYSPDTLVEYDSVINQMLAQYEDAGGDRQSQFYRALKAAAARAHVLRRAPLQAGRRRKSPLCNGG